MINQEKTYYADTYQLTTMVQTQLHIPKKYNPRDYFGGCMRIQEKQTASFLNDFVNGTAVLLPEQYEKMENLLFVLRHSGYKPIKNLLHHARKKLDIIQYELHEHQIAANNARPVLSENTSNKFGILDNKKKMMMMSCSDLCALGDAIDAEREYNTTKIKNKFYTFVTYKIRSVLMGKMPIVPDFKVLLKKYGSAHDIELFERIISNNVTSHTPVQTQAVSTPQPKKQQKSRPVAKSKAQPVKQKKQPKPQPKEKKSDVGFFKKIGASAKKVFNKVKKPLLIGGIFALSIFGGKRIYDSAVEQNAETMRTETHVTKTTPVHQAPVLNITDSAHTNNVHQAINNNKKTVTTHVSNDVMKKTITRLQYLKANNPIDRNMNITQTANRLYQKFGNNASKVVLVTAMTPYALNDYTKFNIRPTTHNMIEYLLTHELTAAQRDALDKFIAQHVKNNSINMNNFVAYNANLLRQNQR